MRLAIDEQWGGPDSRDKCDFLVSHICDSYGGEAGASTLGVFEPTASGSGRIQRPAAPSHPEEDELADVLEGYLADEFEAHVEDGSCDYIAGRICGLHRVIFAQPQSTSEQDPIAQEAAAQQVLAAAQAAVAPLDEAAEKLRNKRVQSQGSRYEGGEGEDDSDDGSSDDDDEGMGVDEAEGSKSGGGQKQEPVVDEDGFTTVVRGKKR